MSTTDEKSLKRTELWLDAERLLEKHNRPVLAELGAVILDLADECEGLSKLQQNAMWAAELAYRLDKRVNFPNELIEALDGVIIFIVALTAISIYRSLEKRAARLGRRIDRLEDLLEDADQMSARARRRRERKLARLKKRLENL